MQNDHPINGLMQTAMENVKQMVEVNTILGEPVESPDGHVIVPVSRVSFGFAAGGSEFEGQRSENGRSVLQPGETKQSLPFGGGSGAGIALNPVAFLVVGSGEVRLLAIGNTAIYDRLLDMAPRLVDKITGARKSTPPPPSTTAE